MKKIFLSASILVFLCLIPALSKAVNPTLKEAMDLTYNAQFDEAERVLDGYIAGNPQDPVAYMIRGTTLDWKQMVLNLRKKLDSRSLEDYKKANKLAFLAWDKDQNDIDKMVNLGNSYMFLAKKWLDVGKKSRAGLILKKCKKHMTKAIEENPSRYDSYLAIGIFNFYAANIPPGLKFLASILGITGDEAKGLSQLQQAASNPSWLQNHAAFVLTHAYGETKKNYSGAQTYLDELIRRFPNNPHFLHLKGEYAMRANQFEKSRQNFDEFFQFCDSKSSVKCVQNYYFLANYFIASGYIKEKKYLETKPYIEKAEKLNVDQFPDRTVNIYYYKGLVYKAEGETKKAVGEFNKVMENQSKNRKAARGAEKELKEMGKP